ncbi:MAG: hypothetical protein HDR37_10900 [Treponema sp.]|nr:hypothetical protein [Treponema sp.]
MYTVIISVVGVLLGATIGAIFPFISAMYDRKLRKEELDNEKLKKRIGSICDQYATFYKLEKLYLQEIKNLRQKTGKENEEDGIRNEFRKKIYKAGEPRIEFSDSGIIAEKKNLMDL